MPTLQADRSRCLNSILLYGGSTDGTDNSAALLQAWAANPEYPSVYFPPGNYAFAGNVTFPSDLKGPVSLMGAGSDTSVLSWPDGGGLTFNCTEVESCVTASNLTIASGCPNGGNGITLSQTGGLPGGRHRPQSNFTNLIFRGVTPADYWSRGVDVQNLQLINFVNVQVRGRMGMSYTDIGVGVNLAGDNVGVIYNFTNCNFDNVGNGIVLGQKPQGINVAACNFVGCTNGILADTASHEIDQLTVANSQFDCKSAGIAALSNVQVGHLFITGNLFLLHGSGTGVFLNLDASTTIMGNIFQGGLDHETGVAVLKTEGGIGGIMIGNRFWGVPKSWFLGSQTENWKVHSNVYVGGSQVGENQSSTNLIGQTSP